MNYVWPQLANQINEFLKFEDLWFHTLEEIFAHFENTRLSDERFKQLAHFLSRVPGTDMNKQTLSYIRGCLYKVLQSSSCAWPFKQDKRQKMIMKCLEKFDTRIEDLRLGEIIFRYFADFWG